MVDKKALYLSLLVIVGLIFAALLTYIVYKLWRYIISRESDGKESKLDTIHTDRFYPNNVPISYTPVPAQEPLQYEYEKDVYEQEKKKELPPTSKWRSINILREVKKNKPFEPKNLDNWKLEIETTKKLQRDASTTGSQESLTEDAPARGIRFQDSLTVEPTERPKRISVSQIPKDPLAHKTSLDLIDRPFQKMQLKPIAEMGHPIKSQKSRKAVDLRGNTLKEEMFLNVSDGESLADSMSMSSIQEDGEEEEQHRDAGTIQFAIRYSGKNRKLQVRIKKASELAPDRKIEEIKPFVRLSLYPGKKRSQNTKVKKEPSKDPFFNETIVFQGLTMHDIETFKLKFKVCNYIRVGKRETLGETELVLSSIDSDDTDKEFTLPLVEVLREDVPKISLSLSVNHEFSDVKLSVTIHNAHIPRLKRSKVDSYVQIELFDEKRFIFKKQTSVKKNTMIPVFEETLSIPLTLSNPDDLKDYTLHVKLLHTTLTGKVKDLGFLVLSRSSSIQSARDHWENVIEKPDVNCKEQHLFPMAQHR